MQYQISAYPVEHYDLALLRSAVEAHMERLEVAQDILPGMHVLLKPNLLRKSGPDEGITTHPALVEAVILWLQDQGVEEISIGDSPGGPYTRQLLEGIYRSTGMAEVAQRTGAQLCYPQPHIVRRTQGEQNLCQDFNILRQIAEADYIINLPKLKTHAMTMLSCGVKNLFGSIPGLQKPELHLRFPGKEEFGRMLVELCQVVRPGLTIVDAVVSMEGDGPSAGELRQTGWIFAAQDIYSLDCYLSHYIGLDLSLVPTVQAAIHMGLGPCSPDQIVGIGGELPKPVEGYKLPASKSLVLDHRIPKFLYRPIHALRERFLSPRPVIARSRCIGCEKCAESCAPGAITMKNNKAVIDAAQCIRCFCCHEMCPVRAISIRRPRLFRL